MGVGVDDWLTGGRLVDLLIGDRIVEVGLLTDKGVVVVVVCIGVGVDDWLTSGRLVDWLVSSLTRKLVD